MKIKNILSMCLIGGILCSCDKFDDYNANPDASIYAPASMIATNLILDIMQLGSDKNFVYDNMLSKQLCWSESMQDYQYNLFGRTSFSDYMVLTNCQKMIDVAGESDLAAYTGLGKFLKAYKLFWVSLRVGDIPYKDALQGEEGNEKPVYDTQKEVMLQILEDLDEAHDLFNKGNNFSGDPVFGGNVENWKKVVTAFQLKVLTHLCLKESDPDLKVKERFADIVSQRSLMTSNNDNLQLVYSDKAGQIYKLYYTATKHATYGIISSVIIDNCKRLNDYRMFHYAAPAKFQIEAGLSVEDWDAYLPIDPSDSYASLSKLYGEGKYSGFNARYTDYPEGEPLMRLSYAEQNFILAEGAIRGWISEDAGAYYKKGIEASMKFIADHTPDHIDCHHNRKMTDSYIQEYLAQDIIQLTGNKEGDLEKILLQRYLGSFLQYPYDAYFDYRRTGYPVLPINPETNLNTVSDKIPVRWMYPDVESSYNTENFETAIQRQYGGSDDVNKLMWILQ